MRHYPLNSPQAAARIVALTLVSDGHLGRAEWQMLERLGAADQLGLPLPALQAVVHDLCEDLLTASHLDWNEICRIDAATLTGLLSEVTEPLLQGRVLQLCVAVAEADAHVADGEVQVLSAAVAQWGLWPEACHG
jgi:hypothetical protein